MSEIDLAVYVVEMSGFDLIAQPGSPRYGDQPLDGRWRIVLK